MYDLSHIQMILHPQKTNHVPRWLGRATQALFFHTLRDIHPEIATYLHDYPRLKPFTVSNIMGAHPVRDLVELRPYQRLRLNLTTLHPHVTSLIWNGVLPIWKRGICVHDQRFYVAEIVSSHYEKTTYAALLKNARDDYQSITLEFVSPTAFKLTGKSGYSARPDAEHIFNSLYRNWNEFAPEPLPTSVEGIIPNCIRAEPDVVYERVRFDKHRLGIHIRGFMGQVRFYIETEDAVARRYLYALASYAPYCGVGVKTTIGLGQVRHN